MKKAILFVVVLFSACSPAHMKNPNHTWIPASRSMYEKSGFNECVHEPANGPRIGDDGANWFAFKCFGKNIVVVGGAITDVLWFPFHALGHAFARPAK